MELTNVFERAAMNKYRFPYKGQISVEDLWDLSLPGLDSVFKQLNKLKKANEEESLLEVKSAEDVEVEEDGVVDDVCPLLLLQPVTTAAKVASVNG